MYPKSCFGDFVFNNKGKQYRKRGSPASGLVFVYIFFYNKPKPANKNR